MIDAFNTLWNETRPAFHQQRTHERARRLAMSSLLCLGRHTITGLICTAGRADLDWSADFRVFERERFDDASLFQVTRNAVLKQLCPKDPFVVFMDDTLLRKRGRKIAGTSWRRDPLGPAFQTNLIWGQRFLQLSAALPEQTGASRARAIPIDLQHCPTPRKPMRNAPMEKWDDYRLLQKESNLTQRGVERLQVLREALDRSPNGKARPLIVSVDGSFTNRTVLKSLPPRTTLIGRIRKDAKLYAPATTASEGRGRKRCYGQRVPTPEALRQETSIPWRIARVYATGRIHRFRYKTLTPVRWRQAGEKYDLRVVVIRPLAYRRNKQSRVTYRQPVYLICTDPQFPVERLIQYYVWRWEIEINFRDEKTLLGMEQAQVRTPYAVTAVPSLITVAYAILLLAGTQVHGITHTLQGLVPKWRKTSTNDRTTTGQLISCFRKQLWGLAIRKSNFSGFMNQQQPEARQQNLKNSLQNAICFAHG